MKRIAIEPRADWRAKLDALGFDWHTLPTPDDPVGTYWDESAYWELTSAEVDELEAATEELHRLCVSAAEHAIQRKLLPHFGFTADAIKLIEQSWQRRDHEPTLYGRFDLSYTGNAPPKMLEYNADTPTGLFEAAVVQWTWLEERFPGRDQFNSLHEGLVAAWAKVGDYLGKPPFHFTCLMPHAEDEGTLRYMLDTALEAGLTGKMINAADIGLATSEDGASEFVDLEDNTITALFKILPWDWMLDDRFGQQLTDIVGRGGLTVIEPAWKMVVSNKAILALLWEMYPNHPNLLPASMDRRTIPAGTTVVAKPLLGREGANVSIVTMGEGGVPAGDPLASSGGAYGAEGYVYQAYAPLMESGGNRAVIGSWMIDGVARGIGIREDTSLITHNRSRFVPHLF